MNAIEKFLVNSLASSRLLPWAVRRLAYRLARVRIENSVLRSDCYFYNNNISFEKDCFINRGCQFFSGHVEAHSIFVGERCFLGMNVLLCCISHETGPEQQRAGENIYAPIRIENGVWIGANAVILPGITIGKGCVIAAGAVVTKDCEPNGVYGGNPARLIKTIC